MRADLILGLSKIGRIMEADGKTPGKGTYSKLIIQNDVKAGSWGVKMALPMIHLNIEAWGVTFRNYLNNNKAKLEKAVLEAYG